MSDLGLVLTRNLILDLSTKTWNLQNTDLVILHRAERCFVKTWAAMFSVPVSDWLVYLKVITVMQKSCGFCCHIPAVNQFFISHYVLLLTGSWFVHFCQQTFLLLFRFLVFWTISPVLRFLLSCLTLFTCGHSLSWSFVCQKETFPPFAYSWCLYQSVVVLLQNKWRCLWRSACEFHSCFWFLKKLRAAS